jgi:hypothetical protein
MDVSFASDGARFEKVKYEITFRVNSRETRSDAASRVCPLSRKE